MNLSSLGAITRTRWRYLRTRTLCEEQTKRNMKTAYPNEPGSQGPETSTQAAEAVKESASTIRAKVFEALKLNPMTAHETAFKISPNEFGANKFSAEHERFKRSVQSRISELSAMNKVEDSGQRRKNDSGINAVVWRVREGELKQGEML